MTIVGGVNHGHTIIVMQKPAPPLPAPSLQDSELSIIWSWLNFLVRNKQRIRAMKTQLWCTHLETNTNLLIKDWRDDFVVVRLCSHSCSKFSILERLSGPTDKVKSRVLSSTSKQAITWAGGQDLSIDSSKPSVRSNSPSSLKWGGGKLAGETPIKSSK